MPPGAEPFDRFRYGCDVRNEKHPRAGRHDLDHFRVTCVEEIVNQHAFGRVELSFSGDFFDQAAKLVDLQDVLCIRAFADQHGGDAIGHSANRPPHRSHQPHPQAERSSKQIRAESRWIRDSDCLGRHFAEQQDQRQHHGDADHSGFVLSVKCDQHARQIDRRGDVDDFVAAQDRNDQPPRLVEQFV